MTEKRKIIKIDEELCNGCGSCVPGCAEQALQLVDTPNGKKARMVKEIYCDGLGACLGACPTGALTIEEREAELFDEAAAMAHAKAVAPELYGSETAAQHSHASPPQIGGCPGSRTLQWEQSENGLSEPARSQSELRQWPVQLHLVPPSAPYFKNADLVFVADCVPFAYPNLHQDFIKDKAIAIACPKLDDTQNYTSKIASIIKTNQPKSIQVVRMQVPCCGGLVYLVKEAAKQAGTTLPIEEIIIGIKGEKITM